MAWLRVDDRAPMHPHVIALRALRDGVVTPSSVVGFVMQAAAWSGQHMTDCEIPFGVAEIIDAEWERLAAAAVKVGMLSKPRRLSDGSRGWLVDIDSGLFHLMSREERARNKHRRITREDQTRVDVHLRDSDLCRYCGQTLNPADTLGGRGREFEHPDPADETVVVTSCRRCNLAKAGRTVAEWVAAGGHELRPAPALEDRFFHQRTLDWLSRRGVDPNRPAAPVTDPATAARPGSPQAPAAAAERPPAPPARAAHERPAATQAAGAATAEPEHPATSGGTTELTSEVPPEGVAEQHLPGRDGTGRVGPGLSVGTSPARPRDGPRRRGSRGRGRRQAPAPRDEKRTP